MATETVILMQPYGAGARGVLKPGQSVRVRDEAEGRRRAEKAMDAKGVVGVQVIEMEVDSELGDYGEPRCLAAFGATPEAAF